MKVICLSLLTIATFAVGPSAGNFHHHPPVKENLTMDDSLEDWFPELRLTADDEKQLHSMNRADTTEDQNRFAGA